MRALEPEVVDAVWTAIEGLIPRFAMITRSVVTGCESLTDSHRRRANTEGTGLLLAHCRKAKAALVMSTHSVYRPPEDGDPHHVFPETDPLGESNHALMPTYAISKIAEETVARTCARQFGLPVTIARMNAGYGRRR